MKEIKVQTKQRIIFRADGNSRIGLGHVTRSLALAAMLRESFECIFAIQAPAVELHAQIWSVCHDVIILPACTPDEAWYSHELSNYISHEEIVVLDGYDFDVSYQQSIKSKGATLVCIDDIHAGHFVADAVISHVVGLKKEQFSVEHYTNLYLGAEYALLRSEFLHAARQAENLAADSKTIFICLGGADPANHTLEVLRQCAAKAPDLKYYVVVGAANKHKQSLTAFSSSAALDLHLLENLDANLMLNYMQQATAAITSASSVAYEYLCTHGLLYLLQTANNQAEVYTYLLENLIALPFTKFGESLTADERAQLIQNGSSLFDGQQAERLLNIFKNLTHHENL